MNSVYEALADYGLTPRHLKQITPLLYQIDDGEAVYALKQSRLSKQVISHWERVFHEANYSKLSTVLPVYLTLNQSLFTEVNDTIFYVSPWVVEQEEQQNKVRDLYDTIGSIHYDTKRFKAVDNSLLRSDFKTHETKCKKMKKQLISTIEQFEAQHFMSPLELQVCMHFRDIELAIILLEKRVQQFLTEIDQVDDNKWGFSLCHGQLQMEHFLSTGENHYLINWESASYQYPVMDLVDYFKHELIYFHAPKDDMIKDFTVYMEKNTLTKSELYLMLIHLLDPTPYLNHVEQYVQQHHIEMIEITKILQRQYRITIFAIELSHFIENEYESLQPMENQSQSK